MERQITLRKKMQEEVKKMFPESTTKQSETLLSNIFLTMLENLQTKENIYIREIGNIHFKIRKERTYILNGKQFKKQSTLGVCFTPSKHMKDFMGLEK